MRILIAKRSQKLEEAQSEDFDKLFRRTTLHAVPKVLLFPVALMAALLL